LIKLNRNSNLDSIVDPKAISKSRKVIDGWTIYKDHELNIGQGGDTPLCPFDCDCCY